MFMYYVVVNRDVLCRSALQASRVYTYLIEVYLYIFKIVPHTLVFIAGSPSILIVSVCKL